MALSLSSLILSTQKTSQLARIPLEDCLPNSLGPHTANTCPKLLCDGSAKGSEISKEQDDPKNTR